MEVEDHVVAAFKSKKTMELEEDYCTRSKKSDFVKSIAVSGDNILHLIVHGPFLNGDGHSPLELLLTSLARDDTDCSVDSFASGGQGQKSLPDEGRDERHTGRWQPFETNRRIQSYSG
ncbi:hypothetical protein E4U44_005794 [Claviceps purpurea]|nr:hypothetical protein E4U44_005794 [Claviceps purpurea]